MKRMKPKSVHILTGKQKDVSNNNENKKFSIIADRGRL